MYVTSAFSDAKWHLPLHREKNDGPPKKSDSANPTVFTENWSKPASFIKSAPPGPVGFQKKSAAA
jgi:hypothetical protein